MWYLFFNFSYDINCLLKIWLNNPGGMQIWQKIVWWNMRVTGFGETLPIMHLTVCRSLSSLSPPFQPNSPPPRKQTNKQWWVKSVSPAAVWTEDGEIGVKVLSLFGFPECCRGAWPSCYVTLRGSHRLHDWSVTWCLQHCSFCDSPSDYQEKGDRFMSSASEALYWH